MVGATRNQVRHATGKLPPPTQNKPAAATKPEPHAPSNTARNPSTTHMQHESPRERYYEHEDASRLSVDLEPMLIGDQTPLNKQPHQAAHKIDALGLHVKDAISTINQLEGLGLQKLNIPLPKIVVLGEQSTGKSSVIEAISGIKTPRSTGTCTRCPLFIKLESPSDPHVRWTARVTLRRSFDWDGKSVRGRRFPGWGLRAQPEIVDFMATEDSNQLENIIARAQSATVTPLVDLKEFLKPSITHLHEYHSCRFSPNVVCISITHPSLPALSFYDLPGIVGQAEDPSEVKFVRDLVVEYVKDEEALVLVTCSLNNDIANSIAGGIARELNATNRCLGVLTKADCLPEGTPDDELREIFDHKKFSLGHGYFVVRNLGQDQLDAGLTHHDARLQEQHFFDHDDRWATRLHQYHSRFGTQKLQSFLSGKLAEQITKRLPIIQIDMDARLSNIENNLKQYPKPPTHNASRIVFDLVLEFSQDVRKEIEAEFPCIKWRNKWLALQKSFFDSLLSLKPTMATIGQRDQGLFSRTLSFLPGRSANDSIVLDDGENEEDVRMSDLPEIPLKKRKMEGTPVSSPLRTPLAGVKRSNNVDGIGRQMSPELSGFQFSDFSEMKTKFQLDAVAKHLNETSKSRIPDQIEHKVINAMMLSTLDNWQLPVNELFKGLEQQLESQIKDLFDIHFDKWKGTALYHAALKIVMEMLSLSLHQQRTIMAEESLNDERKGLGPYIFHSDLFNHDKEEVQQYYRQARFIARLRLYKKERLQRTEKALTPAEEAKLHKDAKLMELLKEEPYSVELGVAAQVMTYFMLAARRFHDSICMRIESKLFDQLRSQLRDELEIGLGVMDKAEGHRKAVRLLAEHPQREAQRRELLDQRNALWKGQKVLRDLQQKKYNDDAPFQASSDGIHNKSGSNSYSMPAPLPGEMENGRDVR